MAALPVELLTQIFTDACTDGGYTGCSLSLVSKHIRVVSRSARFHSVSLTKASAEQVAQFSSHLLAERALSKDTGAIPRVRHLCVTAAKRSVGLLVYLERTVASPKDTELLEFTADVITLLTIVAPDLLTLSLVSRLPLYIAGLPLPDIRRVFFPVLQELSLVSDRALFSPLYDGTPSTASLRQTVFPGLTHLHWTCEDFPSRNTLSLQSWTDAAPRLTHFRISNLNRRTESVLLQLKAAIVPDDEGATWFPKLEHIVVQPSTPPLLRGLSAHLLGRAYGIYLDNLRRLRSTATCQFTLLAGRERRKGQEEFGGATKREWLDRIAGEQGCWKTCSRIRAVSKTPIPHAGV